MTPSCDICDAAVLSPVSSPREQQTRLRKSRTSSGLAWYFGLLFLLRALFSELLSPRIWLKSEMSSSRGPQVCDGCWQEAPRPVFVYPHGAVTAGVSSQRVMGIPLARQRSRRERHQICRVSSASSGLGWEDAELFLPIRLVLILSLFSVAMAKTAKNGQFIKEWGLLSHGFGIPSRVWVCDRADRTPASSPENGS